MRILYDARKITLQATGVGYVQKKLLEQLITYNDLEIIAFTRKGINKISDSPLPSNLTIHQSEDDTDYFGLKRVLFEQFEIPKLIDKYQPDFLHLTNGFGVPLFIKKNAPKIILTIHDLIPLTPYKELMSPLNNFIFKTLFTYGINKADAVVTVSKFTATDVKNYFPDVTNVYTSYNGIDTFPEITNIDKIWSSVQKKYNINREFILYIGGFAPRKNTLMLLEAYNRLLKEKKYDYLLLLCGKFTKNKDISDQIEKINQYVKLNNLQEKVRLIGYLNLDEKQALLKMAKFFVYLSLYEGFGLPILEALSVGTPILTSKNSVMEEVAGKYALFADPKSTTDISIKLNEILDKQNHYKKKAESAKMELIPKFNWKIAGEKYYQIYITAI